MFCIITYYYNIYPNMREQHLCKLLKKKNRKLMVLVLMKIAISFCQS